MYGGNHDLEYPRFIECIKYTDDIFWKNTFEELSYGKCPYGIYISNNHICCNYKDKKFCYKIDETKHSRVIYDDIYDIFKNKFGLLSKNDKLNKNKLFLKKQKEINDLLNKDWYTIKRKNIRIMLIEKFVINKSKKYELSLKQSKQLYNMIILGLLFKTINKSNIVYNNQNIKEIKSISFKQNFFKFNKNIYNFKNDLIFI